MDQKPQQKNSSTGLAPNIASLLCYICPPIISIIFLVLERDDKEVKFHAWQGTAFGVSSLVLFLGLEILAAIMGAIASILGIIVTFFIPLFILAMFILWIICIIKAYQGERWKIPVLGDFAAKKAGLV